MSKLKKIWNKIRRRWVKINYRPIRVFCFHHVCEAFDPASMNKGDWMQIDEFKNKIKAMQEDGVEFISLTKAYEHLTNDTIRCKKYAVLTFDDGYASLKEILPWLEEQQIPATLFFNGKYLDGKSYRNNPKEQYLTKDELFALTSPLIEIGSHGWEHTYASKMTEAEFTDSVEKSKRLLISHPRYISFYAYAYGNRTMSSNRILYLQELIPVFIDGMKNYNDADKIHREVMDV